MINHSFLKTFFLYWPDSPKLRETKKKFTLFTSVYLLYYCKKNHWTWILFTIIRGPDVLDLVPRSLGDETPAKTTAYNSGEEELMLVYLQPNKKKDENRGIEMSRWNYDG